MMTFSRFASASDFMLRSLLLVAAVVFLSSGVCFAQAYPAKVVEGSPQNYDGWLSQEVRHQLLQVPW